MKFAPLLVGVALGGSIPSQPLGTEEFEEITISGSSAISDPYEGHFWTSWSPNYGCAEEAINPMGSNAQTANRNLCRFRTSDILPDSVQWRFCTLPDIKTGSPFSYGTAGRTTNGYYNVYGTPTIQSKHSQAINFFDAFTSARNDWRNVQAPSGDNNNLQGWDAFPGLYTNQERRYVYEDIARIHSTRIACDARLTVAAETCHAGAFSNGNFLGGNAFCDTFSLDDIKAKCNLAGCSSTIDNVNSETDSKAALIEGLILLIEDQLENGVPEWRTYIPSPYKKSAAPEKTCTVRCPEPAEWSSWSCFCQEDKVNNPSLENTLNLPICNCKKTNRYRVQTCSKVTGGSCDMYSDGPVGNYETCQKYGNEAILSGSNQVRIVSGQTTGPNYGYSNKDGWFDLEDILNYDGTLSPDALATLFWKQNSAMTGTTCYGGGANFLGTVQRSDFQLQLSDGNQDLFTFAVEEGACTPAGVEMKTTDTSCSKTCGCGTFTRTTQCVYSATQQPVPQDSDDFQCCGAAKTEVRACNMNCCPQWHECDPLTQTCTTDSSFSPGTVFNYEACTKSCGTETVTGQLRCMCKNICSAQYASNVIVAGAPTLNSYTRHVTSTCATVEAGSNVNANGVTSAATSNAVEVTDTTNYGLVKYRRNRSKACALPCCVKAKDKTGNCPVLNCANTSNKNLPWFITITTTTENGITTHDCKPGDPVYRDSKVCECDSTSTSPVCVENGVTYQKDAVITSNNDPTKICQYPREDYINYNEAVAAVFGKGNSDPYFCCTKELEADLFEPWTAWDKCTPRDTTIDPNGCGCTMNGDGIGCGLQTRRRSPKCAEYKVDDTVCPCVETKKCDIPKCPIQGPPKPVSACAFNPTDVASYKFYSASQCDSSDCSTYKPNSLYSNLFQYNSATADTTCQGFCQCAAQVSQQTALVSCTPFDKDCHNLVWAEWGICDVKKCGAGKQSRHRKCGGIMGNDAVAEHCYNPYVRRTLPQAQRSRKMVDDPDYYEEKDCYVPCDDSKWGPWTECSAPKGKGMQMRMDQHGKFDVRECDGQLGPATGQSEPEYTKCNALCGQGTRLRLIYDYQSNNIEATVENCFMPPCPGDAPAECPAGATPIATQAPPTAAPISKTDTNTPSNLVNNGNSGNTPNDVTVGINQPVNEGAVEPAPPETVEDNNTANINDNDTADTNNDTGNTNNDTGNTDNDTGNTNNDTGNTDPVVDPVTIAPPVVTNAATNAANVESNSRPAVDVSGTASPNTSGTASLTITISLLFGIIINLL